MVQKVLRRRNSVKAGSASVSGTLTAGTTPPVDPPPVIADVYFQLGVAGRVKVEGLPLNYRIRGCWGITDPAQINYSGSSEIEAISFDPVTNEWVYNGQSPLVAWSNTCDQYAIGIEYGPFNNHWEWPPTAVPIPPVTFVGNVATSNALNSPSKHVLAIYTPSDECVRLMFGDFSLFGTTPQNPGQTGALGLWKWHPITNAWSLDNSPICGQVGDVFPLHCDIWTACWLPDQSKIYMAPGKHRGSIADQDAWNAAGGLSTVYPLGSYSQGHGVNEENPALLNNFLWDPATRKFSVVPFGNPTNQNNGYACAYYAGNKRIYYLNCYQDFNLHSRDSTTLNTTGWEVVNVTFSDSSRAGCLMVYRWLLCDEAGKRLLYMDFGTWYTGEPGYKPPALMEITLPGHPDGAYLGRVLAEWPWFKTFYETPMPTSALQCWAIIPEKRKLVLFAEAAFQNGGPTTHSCTVDLDTLEVEAGPRLPNRDGNNVTWTPNWCVWYPPTQELVVGGFQGGSSADLLQGNVNNNFRYKWVDGADNTHPRSPWTWQQVTIAVVDAPPPNIVENNVGTNTIADCDPNPARDAIYTGVAGINGITAYGGMAYAPSYGAQGGIAITGGGHGDYGGNEVYVFDIALNSWARINNPSTALGTAINTPEYFAGTKDAVVDKEYGTYGDGTPSATHTYCQLQVIPSGAKGSLLNYTLDAISWGGGIAMYGFACDLATGVWSRYSVNKCQESPRTTCYDPTNNRVYGIGSSFSYLDLSTHNYVPIGDGSFYNCGYSPCSAAHLVHGLILTVASYYNQTHACRFYAVDPNNYTGQGIELTTTGDPLPTYADAGYGFDWDTIHDRGYIFAGEDQGYSDLNHVWQIAPPASNYLTSAWTVKRITLPTSLTVNVGGGAYGRWRFIPSIGKFAWLCHATKKLSFWTPPAS